MEKQFKIGDEVITQNMGTTFSQNLFNGKSGIIEDIKSGLYWVHKCWWNAKELTLVTKEEEFKKGDEVEVSENNKNWILGYYVGETKDGLFVIEFEGKVSAWIYCRKPKPKMQKWNVRQLESGLILEKDGVMLNPYTIVHSFELPI